MSYGIQRTGLITIDITSDGRSSEANVAALEQQHCFVGEAAQAFLCSRSGPVRNSGTRYTFVVMMAFDFPEERRNIRYAYELARRRGFETMPIGLTSHLVDTPLLEAYTFERLTSVIVLLEPMRGRVEEVDLLVLECLSETRQLDKYRLAGCRCSPRKRLKPSTGFAFVIDHQR